MTNADERHVNPRSGNNSPKGARGERAPSRMCPVGDTTTRGLSELPPASVARRPKAGVTANKAANFWATIRTTKKLLDYGKLPGEVDELKLHEELNAILDSGILIYPSTFAKLGISPETPYRTRRVLCGLEPQSEGTAYSEKSFARVQEHTIFMQERSKNLQRNNWTWRVAQHAEEMQQAGWYPFFVTLTVDPSIADPREVWAPDSKVFTKYIRSLCDVVTDTLGHPRCNKPPYNSQSHYINYMGCIEHGKSREHHHGHFLIWMREIPRDWKTDPNSGLPERYRTKRECRQFRKYWKYSTHPDVLQALYWRTKGDIWSSKLHHVTPIDKDQQPIRMAQARYAGTYITKYLQKDHKEWHHRVKATRNLGMRKLKNHLMKQATETLEALSWRPRTLNRLLSVSSIHSVPLGLLRSESKRMLFAKQWELSQLDLSSLMKQSCGSWLLMQRSVANGARPKRMPLPQYYDWVTQHLPEPEGYCETRLVEAHKLLFPAFRKIKLPARPQSQGGNNIGTTSGILNRRA